MPDHFQSNETDFASRGNGPLSGSLAVDRPVEQTQSSRAEVPPAEATKVPIAVSDLVLHPVLQAITRAGSPLTLSSTEFRLLAFLAAHPGRAFRRKEILEGLYGAVHAVSDRAIDVQVASLRRKLGGSADRIETVRGVGYRFRE